MKGKQISVNASDLTKRQRADAKKADLDKDGTVSGDEEMTTLWQTGVDRHDRDGHRETIRARDSRGQLSQARQAVDSFIRAAKSAPAEATKATSKPAPATRLATTDLTTGLPGQAKTTAIDIQGAGHPRRRVRLVTEQRVTKKRWWSLGGPHFHKKGKNIWNGDVYRLHEDIVSEEHTKGVKINAGKITGTFSEASVTGYFSNSSCICDHPSRRSPREDRIDGPSKLVAEAGAGGPQASTASWTGHRPSSR